MYAQSFKDLVVWQKSMCLVKEVYRITSLLPKEEVYGLSSQTRRCAVSIPSNIAEGYRRNHLPEYVQYLSVAEGSAAELETQLLLVNDLYPTTGPVTALFLLDEIQKMLSVMNRNVKKKMKSV